MHDFRSLHGKPANIPKTAAKCALFSVWNANHETEQLKSVFVDAAAKIHIVERFVLSSLPNPTKKAKGNFTHVYNFESKAKTAEYASEQYPELWKKPSLFQAGLFGNKFVGNPSFQPHMVSTSSSISTVTEQLLRHDGTAELVGDLDPDAKLLFIAAKASS